MQIQISISHTFESPEAATAFLADAKPLIEKHKQLEKPANATALPTSEKSGYDAARETAEDANQPVAEKIPDVKRGRGRPRADVAKPAAVDDDPFAAVAPPATRTADDLRAIGAFYTSVVPNSRERLLEALMRHSAQGIRALDPTQATEVFDDLVRMIRDAGHGDAFAKKFPQYA